MSRGRQRRHRTPAKKIAIENDAEGGTAQENGPKAQSDGPVAHYEPRPILIPGKKLNFPNLNNTPNGGIHLFNTPNGGIHLKRQMSTVDVSAMLDPSEYCRESAFFGGGVPTRNGTEAAKRLLKGKEDLLSVLREALNKKRSYTCALVGHGVPPELLQDHVDMAGSLLRYNEQAEECSFKNDHGKLKFELMRFRSRDGLNNTSPWPLTHNPEREHQMTLYLAVMNRISSNLSVVLWRDHPLPVDSDCVDDDFAPAALPSLARPRWWNVELTRGLAYQSDLLPTPERYNGIFPIVEWIPQVGVSASGVVCIRLQGDYSAQEKGDSPRQRKPTPVTLTFTACFRNEP